MGKYLLQLILVAAVLTSCGPEVKKPEIPARYMEKATKQEVFNQSLIGISMITGGVDRGTDLQKGYIISRPYKSRVEYQYPTLHRLEAEIKKKTDFKSGKTYYLPEFRLTAMQSEDLKEWRKVDPPETYKMFLESSMQERVIVLVSGYIHKFLPANHYLGCIVKEANEPLYTTPQRKQVLTRAGKYQFAELQFKGFQPITIYRDGLLQIKFWLKGGEQRVCWVDEEKVRIFMFEVPNIAGTPEVWKANYKKSFVKAVTRNIGLEKGTEEKWPSNIMQAVMGGTVTEGMTEEQAVAAAGPPDEVVNSSGAGGKSIKTYIYQENNVVLKRIIFTNGKVTKVFSI